MSSEPTESGSGESRPIGREPSGTGTVESGAGPQIEVVKDESRRRYQILVDGKSAGVADYREAAGVVELPHTFVDPSRRGQGLAGILIGHALDDIVASGRKVLPTCPYVRDYLDRHSEYAPSVAD